MKLTADQEKAVKSTGNVIVSAGAGSGKTAVLTRRVIYNILGKNGSSKVNLDELLILTFTNEAASSMKNKIKKALSETDELKHLIPFVDSAHIETFDAYAQFVVTKYGYKYGYPKNINVITSDILNVKVYDTIHKLIDEEFLKQTETFKNLIFDYVTKSENNLENFLVDVYKNVILEKENPADFLKNFSKNLQNSTIFVEIVNDVFEKYSKKFKENLKNIDSIYDENLKNVLLNIYSKYDCFSDLDSLIKAKDQFSSYQNDREKARKALSDFYEIEEQKNYDTYVFNELTNTVKILASLAKYDYETFYNIDIKKEQVYLTYLIDNILLKAVEEIEKFKKEFGYYTFGDIAKIAIEIVKNHEDVRNELKNQYKLIMIDEYQDTSFGQEEFINLIENNNVFCVGDIKQSIYRFRGAVPSLFQNKFNRYSNNENGNACQLNANFRCRKEIIDTVNDMFSVLMKDDFGGANYQKEHIIIAGRANEKPNFEEGVFQLPYAGIAIKDGEIVENKALVQESEALSIARNIKIKMEESMNAFKNGQIEKPLKYSDFAILSFKGKCFDKFEKVFKEEGVPLNAVYDEEINSDISIIILINIFKIISLLQKEENEINDNQIKHLLVSLFRSFLFSYNDTYIFNLFSSDDAYKSNEFYLKLKEFAKNHINSSIQEIFDEIFDVFSYVSNISKLNEVINTIDKNAIFYENTKIMDNLNYTLDDFVYYLEVLDKAKIKMDQTIYNESKDAVKIITIHKSKGLEYPIVYLANNKDFVTPKLKEPGDYYIIGKEYFFLPLFSDPDKEANLFGLKFLDNEENIKADREEKLRLLYVALTRAREKIVLVVDKEPYLGFDKSFNNEINYFKEKYKANKNYVSEETILEEAKKHYQMVIDSRKGDNFDDFYRNSLYFFPLEQSCDPRLLDLKSEIRKDVLSRKLKDVDENVLRSKKFKKIYELYLKYYSTNGKLIFNEIKDQEILDVLAENKKKKTSNENYKEVIFEGPFFFNNFVILEIIHLFSDIDSFIFKIYHHDDIKIETNFDETNEILNLVNSRDIHSLCLKYLLPQFKENGGDEILDNIKPKEGKIFKELIIEPIKREMSQRASKVLDDNDIDDLLIYGTHMHSLLEIIDFLKPDFSLIKDENDKKKIKKIIDLLNENFDLSNAKIMKEYQFKDEEINLSGVIDLLLIFDKKAAILDYKLKNIDDEHYIYQLEKYKNYIKKAFNFDDVETYLISIIDTKIKKIVID